MMSSIMSRSFLCRNTVGSNFLMKVVNNGRVSLRNLYCSATVNSKKYIYKSSQSEVEIPKTSLLKYLRQRCQNNDDSIALVSAETGEELHYGELWNKVEKMGSAFARLGVGKGSIVALVSPNCPEFAITLLAISAAGGSITTVNSQYTAEEISRQLQISGASVVIYHPSTATEVLKAIQQLPPGAVVHRICTHQPLHTGDLCLPTLCGDDGQAYPKDLEVDPSSDVLVLPFSSGTTGMPKGVMLTHFNIVANLQQMSHPSFVFTPEEDMNVMFAVLPMFHIYGLVADLFLSLATGSKLVTFTKFHPQIFMKAMMLYKPTVVHTVPPILHFLVQTPEVLPELMSSVRSLVCAAAPVGDVLVQQIHNKFTHDMLFQEGYGMTELSPVSHMSPLNDFVPGSCGQLLPNTMCKLVHVETGETLAPEDGDGELCVKGPQVMKGYFNNEEATASTIDAEGWLHTGDIARVDSRSNFYIVDRLKELIKVKGFQVAPAELEDLLRGCPGVSDAAVIGVLDDKAGEVPRAYVVKDPTNGSVTEEQIQKFVSSKMSAHKHLAGGVVFIDVIPKSTTGKILRKGLRELALL